MAVRAFSSGFGPGFGSHLNVGQLALIVGTHPTYEDGDVLCAFNRRHIRCIHAEHICHVKDAGFNWDGLRPAGCLAQSFRNATHQYRFVRVGNNIERHELGTATVDVFGSESIDVELFLKRRKQHARHAIFGTTGSEYWYGGHIDVSHAKLDMVWNAIETDSPEREVNYQNWPFSPQELRRFLVLSVDDFDDQSAGDLTSSIVDDADPVNPVMVKKRRYAVQWRALRDVIEADVLNVDLAVDIRGRKHIRGVIVGAKP